MVTNSFSNIGATALSRSGLVTLEAELAAEKANALGRTARAMQDALEALKAYDATAASAAGRDDLVSEAARCVWIFFVQREMTGMRDHRPVIADYAIPREVLNRVGQIKVDPKNDTPSVLKYIR